MDTDGQRGLRKPTEEKTLLLRTIQVERKQVTIALKEDHLGRFLKITEEAGGR